jgi:hypothetical protein
VGAYDQRPHRFGSAGCWQYEISVRAECLCRNGKEGNHLVAGWVGIQGESVVGGWVAVVRRSHDGPPWVTW